MLEKDKQAEESDEPLMCDLPDDLALLCIARVPRRFHHVLRCVSRRWRALLSSEEWHLCRRKNNVGEAWIYVMCTSFHGENFLYVLDPERQSWKRLRAIPSACLMREGMSFEALGKKLYLFGGCSWENDYADDVYFYDPSAEKWKEAARMPTARVSLADFLELRRALGWTVWSVFSISAGCGLCTVVLNVNQAANAEGMLVTSSFDPHIKGIFFIALAARPLPSEVQHVKTTLHSQESASFATNLTPAPVVFLHQKILSSIADDFHFLVSTISSSLLVV